MLRQRKPQCPKCEHAMEEGFIPDVAYGAVLLGSWAEGTPEKRWTGSVKMKGRRKLDITTCRCTSCGYLESYANP
jgi:hypothetical protein